MDKYDLYPEEESAFHAIYEADHSGNLIDILDHIKLKGETLISVADNGYHYTIVVAKQ